MKVAEYILTSLLELIKNMFQLEDKWQFPMLEGFIGQFQYLRLMASIKY